MDIEQYFVISDFLGLLLPAAAEAARRRLGVVNAVDSSDINVVNDFVDQLIDEVGENEEHPLAELLSILGGIILIHERVEEGMQMAEVM